MSKISFNIGPVFTTVRGDVSDARLEWFDEMLAFEGPPAFYFAGGKVRHNNNVQKMHLFSYRKQQFPTGLFPLIRKRLLTEGNEVSTNDLRTCAPATKPSLAWLRPEQIAAVERGIKRKHGIFWMPTGSGKTEVAIGLAQRIPCRWLFVVHKKDLMHQAAERYTLRTGEEAGKIGDGLFQTDKRFTVATFQTLARGVKLQKKETLDLLASVGGLMVDEAHALPANSFWTVAMNCGASYRFGFSGTPLARLDKRSVYTVAALGPIIFRLMPQDLIDSGRLAKPIIHMPKLWQETHRPTWQGIYGETIVASTRRNNLIKDLVKHAEKPCLVFVKQVNHGQQLAQRLQRQGVPTEFVWGDKQTSQRQESIRRLVKGDLDCLVASVIFQEGIDIPELRSLVVASAGKSVIATIQRIGRGMRLDEGKTEFHVWDIYDEGHKITERWSKARLKAYRNEGYEVTTEEETK